MRTRRASASARSSGATSRATSLSGCSAASSADLPGEHRQVDRLAQQLAAPHPGESHERVHEAPERLRGGAHAPQVGGSLGGEVPGLVLHDERAEAVDAAQGGAHVVGHGVGQCFELPSGGLELLGAAHDPLAKLRR